jgi:superfamily II RNA helicase
MGRLEKGVAFHHSGLLPVLKEIVEILFVRGFIKLLFATETFSVGLNMPAKTVIMTSLRKNDEYGIRMLRRDEYTQMAGRAGRRGKDTSGLVVYIPDRDPESLEDVKTMMTQGTQELHSKMLFNYEFLLRCIYGHKLGWMSLVKKSYWFVEHNRRLNGLERDLADVKKRIASLHIDDFMLSHFDEREELERHFKRAVTAEKKMAQRNLESWKNKHVGPRWDAGWMAYNERLSLEHELAQIEESIERHENFYQDIEPLEKWLNTQGFIGTLLGTLASNIHVGHPILMARAFHDKVFHNLEIPQLLGCLAMFVDSQRVEFVKPTECRHLTKDAEDCMYTVLGMAETYKATDPSDDDPWILTAYWVDPVIRWANNENYLAICTEYDLYEGDFVKSMLTMGKIVEEWIKLATLVNETETLERLTNLHSYIIKGVVVPDSLYVSL